MGDPALAPEERYTFRHYRSWPDSERWELIQGQAYAMSPAPKTRHQKLLWRLSGSLYIYLQDKTCSAFTAPFDVLLPQGEEPDEEVDTIVQPDISVFCDPSKLTERGARGAPDLVMEILSPSTSRKDQHEKFEAYERAGVREYWVVDPAGAWLCRYILGSKGRYDEGELRERLFSYGPIESTALKGFVVNPEELFRD